MGARVQTVWSSCLERISDRVPKYSYNTWIRPLRAISLEEGNNKVLNLEVPNQFHQKWIEENYFDIVDKSLRDVLGPQAALQLSLPLPTTVSKQVTALDSRLPEPPPPQHPSPVSQPVRDRQGNEAAARPQRTQKNSYQKERKSSSLQLNSNYTFEELVEGEGNRLAYNAAEAIARKPGATSFNPLFVYGPSGLGKTHLAQAICQYAIEHGTAENPIYVTIDDFTNSFIASIRANCCHKFTSYFRQADLLVVDDIQFLTGKERTQEEFFHLFNTIHHSGGQIVLCADRAPRDIAGIHNRLTSRFQWGLTTDVKTPDLSTRIAIVVKKAERYKIDLSDEIIERIAYSVQRNIRELESILTKILAYSSLHNSTITLQLTEQILQQYGKAASCQITIDEIIKVVAETFGTRPEYIVGKSRKREIVLARHAAMHLAKEFTQHSLKSIGLQFAGRDHSTVIHAIKAVEARIDTEESFRIKFDLSKQVIQRHMADSQSDVVLSNSDRT